MNRAAAVAVLAFATTAITPRATTILPVQEIFSSSSRYRHLRRRRSLATAASGGSTTKPGAATAGFVSTFAPRPSIPFLITAEANQRASWSSLFRRGSSTHWSHPQRLTRSQDGRIGLQSRCESCNELLANRVSSTRLARQEEGVASRGVQSLLGGTSAAGFETRPTSGLTQQQQKQQQQQQQQAGGRSEMREDGAAAGSAVGFDFALRPLPFFDVDGANSMITRVQVDNLAMVDSVTVEVSAQCRRTAMYNRVDWVAVATGFSVGVIGLRVQRPESKVEGKIAYKHPLLWGRHAKMSPFHARHRRGRCPCHFVFIIYSAALHDASHVSMHD